MFSLWTVNYFYFSSSLMIFSLRIMGLETCACGFIFLSCVVFPSFFVVLLLLLLLLLMCSLSCVFAPDFSSLLSAHFLSHPSPLSVCLFLWCDPLTPLPEDTDSPSQTNSGLSFLLLCFSHLPRRRVPAPLCLSHAPSGSIHPKLKFDLSSRES